MKRIFIIIIIMLVSKMLFAQSDTLPIYKRFPELPPFSIIRIPDSIKFTKDDLQRNRSVMIMIFSPDCDHCRHAIRDVLANIEKFKKTQIVLASPLDFKILEKFYYEFKIADYPNISVGRDLTYFFGSFYRILNYPSVYIYNKKGKLSAEFSGSLDINKALKAL